MQTINGTNYDIGKLNALEQLHVTRRLAPLLKAYEGLAGVLADATDEASSIKALGEAGEVLAALPEDDVNYIIKTSLKAVRRQGPGGTGWCSMTSSAGDLMFADMPLPELIQLVFAVLRGSLGDFFGAFPPTFPVAETPKTLAT